MYKGQVYLEIKNGMLTKKRYAPLNILILPIIDTNMNAPPKIAPKMNPK